MVPKVPVIFCSMSVVLEVLTIQTSIVLYGVSSHLIRPFEEWLILDFLQNLMYRFSEYGGNRLRVGWSWLPCEISPWMVIVVSVRPKITPLLRDNILLSFPLQLVLFHSFLFVNSEFVFKSLNHLIATGPRLDGKTLHIKVSFWEWMVILWLNWLTCSTRSVQPL